MSGMTRDVIEIPAMSSDVREECYIRKIIFIKILVAMNNTFITDLTQQRK